MRADITNVQQSVKIRHVEAAIVQDLVHSYLRTYQDQRVNAVLTSPDSHALKIDAPIGDADRARHLPDNKVMRASADLRSSVAFSSDRDAARPRALIRSFPTPRR